MTSVSESRGLMLYMRKESGLLLWHLLARRVPCRMQEEHWLEPSAFLLELCDPKASFQNRLLGSTIPMAIAHAARRQRHEHILRNLINQSIRSIDGHRCLDRWRR